MSKASQGRCRFGDAATIQGEGGENWWPRLARCLTGQLTVASASLLPARRLEGDGAGGTKPFPTGSNGMQQSLREEGFADPRHGAGSHHAERKCPVSVPLAIGKRAAVMRSCRAVITARCVAAGGERNLPCVAERAYDVRLHETQMTKRAVRLQNLQHSGWPTLLLGA